MPVLRLAGECYRSRSDPTAARDLYLTEGRMLKLV